MDIMELMHKAAKQFALAKTEEELDHRWKELVSPHYFAIPKTELGILTALHDLSLTIIQGGLRR